EVLGALVNPRSHRNLPRSRPALTSKKRQTRTKSTQISGSAMKSCRDMPKSESAKATGIACYLGCGASDIRLREKVHGRSDQSCSTCGDYRSIHSNWSFFQLGVALADAQSY